MREGWIKAKLGDVCDLYQPKTISSNMLEEDGKYLVYGANGIIGRYNEYNHEKPEVLMTCRGATCGTINVSQPYSWINGNAMVVHPKRDIIRQPFLKYLLQGIDLSGVITGAAQPQITRQSLKPVQVSIPPIQEQEKIVAELDCLTGIIEKKKQQLDALDKLAQSIFYEMFGDPITNEKGWKRQRIGAFSSCLAGATPSTKHEEYWENGYIPWLSSGEVGKGRIYDTEKKITQEGYDSCSTRLIPAHTLVIAMAGQGKTRGTAGVAEIPLCTNQSICSIIPDERVALVDFLYYQMQWMYTELRSISNGNGGRGGLNLKLIGGFSVILPPLDFQKEFAQQIEAIEKQTELVRRSIMETEALFNCTMDKYFG